ncbi:hypothetical protein IWX90DRAFT_155542 [Phyllosticta citrichinensis]|uniref:Uncharacterized protein n=1 Tax=Phyllosticta citrichinensis TaxID=1130410 RepID=A0ABR1XZX5_9PEZI
MSTTTTVTSAAIVGIVLVAAVISGVLGLHFWRKRVERSQALSQSLNHSQSARRYQYRWLQKQRPYPHRSSSNSNSSTIRKMLRHRPHPQKWPACPECPSPRPCIYKPHAAAGLPTSSHPMPPPPYLPSRQPAPRPFRRSTHLQARRRPALCLYPTARERRYTCRRRTSRRGLRRRARKRTTGEVAVGVEACGGSFAEWLRSRTPNRGWMRRWRMRRRRTWCRRIDGGNFVAGRWDEVMSS